jgi:2-dehydropantoate 2-reductase
LFIRPRAINRMENKTTVSAIRIGILGSGAMGAFYGARLSRAGHDVHFLMRSDYDAVRSKGLFIKSFEGDFHIHPPAYRTASEMGACDLLIVGLKSTDNDALPDLLRSTTTPESIVLTLQNGLGNEEAVEIALNGLYPDLNAEERVLGGVAFICSNRTGAGEIHHMDHGWIRMAEFRGPARERTNSVAELFRSAGIRCDVYDSLITARWEKLVWNIPFNGLGVAARADTERILSNPALCAAARGLMDEVIAAAAGDGVTIKPSLAEKMMKNTTTMGAYRTSMQIDYEAGRPLEVEAIIGEPLRRAQRADIPTPRLEMLYGIIRECRI